MTSKFITDPDLKGGSLKQNRCVRNAGKFGARRGSQKMRATRIPVNDTQKMNEKQRSPVRRLFGKYILIAVPSGVLKLTNEVTLGDFSCYGTTVSGWDYVA